jgi:acetyl esterase/lipase
MDESILSRTPPRADARLSYGPAPVQFLDLFLPSGQGPFPVAFNIHGGFWRAKYDLAHAGHLCAGLARAGFAAFNLEYRRVGDPGGGWPGSFEDVRNGFRHLGAVAEKYQLRLSSCIALGHSAGGQLALALASYERSLRGVLSLAGVTDLHKAYALHLSHDAAAEFLGGTPEQVPDHYREASPLRLSIPGVKQTLFHGQDDDTVPVAFSREYVAAKKPRGEKVELVELEKTGHYEWIDPETPQGQRVMGTAKKLAGS